MYDYCVLPLARGVRGCFMPGLEIAVEEADDVYFRAVSLVSEGVIFLVVQSFLVPIFGLSISFVSPFLCFRVPFLTFLRSFHQFTLQSCHCHIASL